MRVVAEGEQPDGLKWAVLSRMENEELFTFLSITTDGIEQKHGGFGGPPVYNGQLVNSWIGRLSDNTTWVMVRTTPQVSGVEAADSSGNRYDIPLQGPDPEFGLNFGAVKIPSGVEIVQLLTAPDGGKLGLFTGSLS